MTPGRSVRCRSLWARQLPAARTRSVTSSAATVTRSSGSTPVSLMRCGRYWGSPKWSCRHCRCASCRTGRGWHWRRFGAELLRARHLAGVSADGPGYVAELSDGTLIRGRAVLFASGVEWRRLDVSGIDDLLGAGGRAVLAVRTAGHAAGPRPRPRRVDVALSHRSGDGDPEC